MSRLGFTVGAAVGFAAGVWLAWLVKEIEAGDARDALVDPEWLKDWAK